MVVVLLVEKENIEGAYSEGKMEILVFSQNLSDIQEQWWADRRVNALTWEESWADDMDQALKIIFVVVKTTQNYWACSGSMSRVWGD